MKLTYTNLVLASALAPLFIAEARAQAPSPPSGLKAIPNYGAKWIELRWMDNSNNELGFKIVRSTNGGGTVEIGTTGPNQIVFGDATVNANDEYLYAVAAYNAAGTSAFAGYAAQNLKVLWPIPASHEVLHNWNETIGEAGIGDATPTDQDVETGFHRGVDLQRSGNNNDVIAARGGVIAGVQDGQNGYVIIQVKTVTGSEFDEYNHLGAGVVYTLADVLALKTVKAGDKLGIIDQSGYFQDAAGNVVNFVDHCHFDQTQTFGGPVVTRHPLLIFSANADKDPGGANPAFTHHVGSPAGTILWREDDPDAATEVPDATHPLRGDVDLIVEVADALGTSPDHVPQYVAWWIEPPLNQACTRYAAVRSSAAPYVLFDGSRRYFGAGLGDATYAAFLAQLVDTSQNYGANLVVGGENYPWENYKHFIVTNTKGVTGAPADVSAAQHWNTDARSDATLPNAPDANMAFKMDATHGGEARFPDGTYVLKVRMGDLIHPDVVVSQSIRVENFPPIVCEASPKTPQPSTTTSVQAYVLFNEPMDTSVAAASLVTVDNGAMIAGAQWSSDRWLVYTVANLKKNTRFTVTIKKDAKDVATATGANLLDGNKDGSAGDDFRYGFFVNP